MPREYKCISGDGHIDLNPDIWRDHVQAKWRDRAPKRVKMPNGSDAVVISTAAVMSRTVGDRTDKIRRPRRPVHDGDCGDSFWAEHFAC